MNTQVTKGSGRTMIKPYQVRGLPELMRLVNQIRWAVIVLGFIIGAIGAAMLAAPMSHADTNDQLFLETLAIGGISFQGSTAQEIQAAHTICQFRAEGYSDNEVEQHMMSGGMIGPFSAGYVVGAAEAAYCPEYSNDGPNDHRMPTVA